MKGLQGVALRTTIAAVSGGVASALTGGKFADGAYSAAFLHLFNDEMHNVNLLTGMFNGDLTVSQWFTSMTSGVVNGSKSWWAITKDMFQPGTPNGDAGEYQIGSFEDKWVTRLNGVAMVSGTLATGVALAAPRGVAVVWQGTANYEMATLYATTNGLRTLGQTIAGRGIIRLSQVRIPYILPKGISWAVERRLWQVTSAIYVLNARSVQIFVDKVPNFNSIFYQVEYPILKWRGLIP